MEDILKIFLESYLETVSNDSIKLFKAITTYKEFSKGDTVVEHGKPTSKFYVLEEGFAGSFITNDKGKQFIRTIYPKYKAFGALSSLIKDGDSDANANYICLTDCKVYEVNWHDYIKLQEQSCDFLLILNNFLEEVYLRTEKKMDAMSLLSTKDRYLNLKKEIPKIDHILPQYQIAYYLNITPVQLSRIRKKLSLS